MLLPENIHPQNSVYFNGAIVLGALQRNDTQDLITLFQNTKKDREISFSLFVLCLDWLYLIGAAQLNNDGIVELCS